MGENPREIPKELFSLAKIFPQYVRKISEFSFDYEIGAGGYGVVHHGTDKVTGKEVAIKQLKRERLKDALEQKYVQEVFTTASCKDRFIVKLVGFTIEEPYSIIAEFLPKGPLSKVLYHRSHKERVLSPKQLTVIALGVATGLSHMRSIGLIHRDIKASNILLNEKNIPTIIDFGIAQFTNSTDTKPAGTAMYMAPEVFGNSRYNSSVDVFSFGMLLYEMSERHVAYNHYSKEELNQLAQNRNVYPEFSSRTPIELQNLITRCWGLPKDRPQPEEIYELFKTGQVSFNNFDKSKLPQIVQALLLEQQEYKRLIAIQMKPLLNIDEEVKRIRRRRESNASFHDLPSSLDRNTINWAALTQYNSPDFIPTFKHSITKFRTEDLAKLFNTTSPVFVSGSPELMEKTLECYRDVMISNIKFVDTCYKGQLIPRLPSATDGQIRVSLDILALIFEYKPESVSSELDQLITYYIQVRPEEMILLISHYVKHIYDIRAVSVLDNLLMNANVYENIDSGYYYLTLYFNIMGGNEIYAKERMQYIRPWVVQFTKSKSSKTAAMAYRVLTHLRPQPDEINFVTALEQLDDEVIQPELLKALFYVTDFPNSRRFAAKLIRLAKNDEVAFDVLCAFAATPANMKIVANDPSWYVYDGLPTITNSFKMLLYLFTVPEVKDTVRNSPHFPRLLLKIARTADIFILTVFPSLIRRSSPDVALLNELDQNGFLEVFFQRTAESGDETAIYNAITLTAAVGSICFVPSLVPQIGRLKGFMTNNNFLPSVITIMPTISALKECKPHLSDLCPYFTNLLQYKSYAHIAQTFLANMK